MTKVTENSLYCCGNEERKIEAKELNLHDSAVCLLIKWVFSSECAEPESKVSFVLT